jgi:hypothetical protein
MVKGDFNAFWERIAQGKVFMTPDKGRAAAFTVTDRCQDRLRVRSQRGNSVSIGRQAFAAVLRHLAAGGHDAEHPCPIGSNQDRPGTLGFSAKQANGHQAMVITYILPILQDAGLVAIDGNRPNRTWLLQNMDAADLEFRHQDSPAPQHAAYSPTPRQAAFFWAPRPGPSWA